VPATIGVMETKLAETALRNGQRVDLLCIQPPAGKWRDRIAPFLAHKGQPFNWHIETNLGGHNDELEQRFFIASIGETVISEMMVAEKHGLAILGHVFTDPDWREQGATTALMRVMSEDFVARDGIAMHLFTGYDSPAFRIYSRFGFEPMGPESGFMKWVRRPERFDAMFEPSDPGDVHVERTCWTHWPLVHKLILRDEGDWLRNAALSLAGPCSAEDAFVLLMSRLKDGPPLASAVLVNQAGMTVGLATLQSYKRLFSRMLQLDVYVHPSATDHLGMLIDAIGLPNDRPVMTEIDANSPQRHQALLDAGFHETGRLKHALTAVPDDLDLLLLQA